MNCSADDISSMLLDAQRIKRAVLGSELSGVGLMTGELGKALYCGCQYIVEAHKDDSLFARANESLSFSIEEIRRSPPQSIASLTDGFTGLAVVINRLLKFDILDQSFSGMLSDIEDNVEEMILSDSNKNGGALEYDYFYGVSGIANYFLSFSESKNKKRVIKGICNLILQKAIPDPLGLKWKDDHGFSSYPYNLGLAHGMLSIICILSKAIYSEGLNEYRVDLVKAVTWYLGQENDAESSSRFSSSVDDTGAGKNEKNWLAWCYGDLSVSISLLHVYKATGDSFYLKKAVAIIDSTLCRNDASIEIINSEGSVFDAGLCHGLASVCAAYNTFYKYFKDERYYDTLTFWMTRLSKRSLSISSDSSAGSYSVGRIGEIGRSANPNVSLLEGAAGVGLFYASFINKGLRMDWEPIFFLDIA